MLLPALVLVLIGPCEIADRRAPPKPRPVKLYRTLPTERADKWRLAFEKEGTTPKRFARTSQAMKASASLPAIGRTGGASPDGKKQSRDPSVSHFSIKNDQHLWQYVGRVEPSVQRPMPRRSVLDLHDTYRRTMDVCMAAGKAAASGMEPDGVRGDVNLAQDFMNMRNQADETVCAVYVVLRAAVLRVVVCCAFVERSRSRGCAWHALMHQTRGHITGFKGRWCGKWLCVSCWKPHCVAAGHSHGDAKVDGPDHFRGGRPGVAVLFGAL